MDLWSDPDGLALLQLLAAFILPLGLIVVVFAVIPAIKRRIRRRRRRRARQNALQDMRAVRELTAKGALPSSSAR
jgi:hypothetical protein